MTERRMRNLLGLFLVVSHVAIVATVLVEYALGGIGFPEMTTAVALVVPMFSAYVAVIVKYFIETRTVVTDDTPRVSGPFVVITLLFPIAFVILIEAALIVYAANLVFGTFEQLKGVLAIIEGGYGIYLAKIVDALFPKGASPAQSPTA